MDEGIERDNTWGEGAFLRCPVSNSVQFSLRNEGSTEYMCVRGRLLETIYIDARVPVQKGTMILTF